VFLVSEVEYNHFIMANKLYFIVIAAGLFWLAYILLLYWRTKVPIVRTPRGYIKNLVKNLGDLNINSDTVICELGSGKGDFLFAVEKFGPKKLIGYELSPLHLFYSRLKTRLIGSRATFLAKDFFKADLSEIDIAYVFLVPQVVKKLWQKMKQECRPGTVMVLLGHDLPGENLVKKVKTRPEKLKSTYYYFYQV